MSRRRTYLPAQPIVDKVDTLGGLATLVPMAHRDENGDHHLVRSFYKIRASGRVSLDVADELCVRLLGMQPPLVYGAAWWDAIDEPDPIAEAWLSGETPLVLDYNEVRKIRRRTRRTAAA